MTLPTLIDIARHSHQPSPLRCPCGGTVRLDGWAVQGESVRYLCHECGTVRTSLAGLVLAQEKKP